MIDSDTFKRLRDGDTQAFEQIVHAYQHEMPPAFTPPTFGKTIHRFFQAEVHSNQSALITLLSI